MALEWGPGGHPPSDMRPGSGARERARPVALHPQPTRHLQPNHGMEPTRWSAQLMPSVRPHARQVV
jgi:hypothetical protein